MQNQYIEAISPEDKLKIKFAEQHRNTRHDAIDKITEIRARWEEKGYNFSPSDNMMNEIMGAIMNLKQREPKED